MHSATNQRRETRVKLFQPALMKDARVHLLNISTGGALVHAEAAPPVGEVIELSGGLGRARVAWRDGRRFGVAFLSRLAQDRLDEILRPRHDLCTVH